MKKLCVALALLLCLTGLALAEDGVRVEVIKMDGVSVIRFTSEEQTVKTRSLAQKMKISFNLPQYLTLIEEEAFAGIGAETVEVSENVLAIEARAFAGCKNLTRIVIPATVQKIDDSALADCKDVTVYGAKGSEAERFATENGFDFAVLDAEEPPVVEKPTKEAPPVQLPYVEW